MSTVASYQLTASSKPRRPTINPRMAVIAAIFAALVGYPVYSVVRAELNHGVEKTNDGYFVDLKALGNFRLDENNGSITDVPERFRELDGKNVTLDGFMWSSTGAGAQVSRWEFVYNVTTCCFNGPPRVQERVFAASRDGVPFDNAMVRMTGILHVGLQRAPDNGKVIAVYTMEVKRVEQLS